MMSYIDRLIYKGDRLNREHFLKGRYFLISTMLFFLMCLSSIPYYVFVAPTALMAHPGMFYTNVVFTLLILALMLLYSRFGGRVVLVNIMTFLGWTSNFATFELNGAIFAPDNIWCILISCWVFLVANRLSGIIWFGVSLLTLTAMYFLMGDSPQLFLQKANLLGHQYHYINYILAVLFLLPIVFLYDKNKDIYKEEIERTKSEVELKSKELELRNRDILDSIEYAHKIQSAVLPHEESIARTIPLWFILYKPKDIVSGDFYWFHEIDRDNYIFICADCTGHGVPGAFMTVISSNLLNQTVIDNKIYSPAKILQEVDRLLVMTLKQDKERYHNVQDGMDLSVMRVDKVKREVVITSAKRPVVYIRDKQAMEIPSSKFSLGGMRSGEKRFEETRIQYRDDDMIYFFTDGYHDQFGGPKGKKFSSKKLKEKLMSVHTLTLPEQKKELDKEFETWKKGLEQLDDVCVIGVRL